ncbi:Rap1a/Tai family immunity protein [Lichenicoccus sp.]|uniref:Rap1a/Tai family immunity protein n=1 Tax=Lichenicoccus sp. TaxID=2781899 RepID=UPI003D0EEA45
MRSKMAGLCALVGAAWLPVAAQGQDQGAGPYSYKTPSPTTITSFQSLFDMCVSSSDDTMARSEHAVCVGYFTGLIDLYISETTPAARTFCLPTDPPLTRQQARDKLVVWSGTNPAAMSLPAAAGVLQFLNASFPCSAPAR